MPISISNLSVVASAKKGTLVGVLSLTDTMGVKLPATFAIQGQTPYFRIPKSNANLLTDWPPPASLVPGNYPVVITGRSKVTPYSATAEFTVLVRASSSPPQPSISPDGSVMIGQPVGGGLPASLRTAYGIFKMRARLAAEPGWGGGTYCETLLNDQPMMPGGYSVDNQRLPQQQLRVNYGGRLFGITHDQVWQEWTGYRWGANDGTDFASGPAPTPIYSGLPNFNPPYIPSPENTSISGGTGSLQTIEGVFSFGPASGSGWRPNINGLTYPHTGYVANLLTVYGHGRLFVRLTDGTWYYWAGNQFNVSTGPTASPVPVDIQFSPLANPTINHSDPVGTVVASAAVTMSDGSPFSGTLALTGPPAVSYFSISGSRIVTAVTPVPSGDYFSVTATQSGGSFISSINIYVV